MAFNKDSPFGGGGGAQSPLSPEDAAKAVRFLVRLVIIAPLIILLLWGSLSSFYTVQPEERGVIRRFGAFIGFAESGLHFKLPFGIDSVTMVPTERVLKQEFGFRTDRAGSTERRTQYSSQNFQEESLMLTGDLNIIDVEWVVQYTISEPDKYLFNLKDPTDTLRDVSEAVMRRIVGNRLGSSVLTIGRVDIAARARDEIQGIMRDYDSGIHVSTVELQDVVPPDRVQPAFNEVNVARQERERMINEAEKRRNQLIPRTEGEALQAIAEARGYAAERVNRSMGDVARFNAILTEYLVAPEVTRRRMYLEAVAGVLPEVGSVIVVQEEGVSPIPLLSLNEGSNLLKPQGGSSK